MSTRANISLKREEGTVVSVYQHSDGYPTHWGEMLLSMCGTRKKVEKFVKEAIQEGKDVETYLNLDEYFNGRSGLEQYFYLWNDNEWLVQEVGVNDVVQKNSFMSLNDAIQGYRHIEHARDNLLGLRQSKGITQDGAEYFYNKCCEVSHTGNTEVASDLMLLLKENLKSGCDLSSESVGKIQYAISHLLEGDKILAACKNKQLDGMER